MKILIAEDETVSRRILQKTLQRWNYDVVAVKDGREAINAFDTDRFSIIITDWMMPEMDGLELVRAIRRKALSEYVYIIMLTAKSEKEDLVEGMEAGADDFVAKPFDKEELRARVRAGERVIELEKDLFQRNEQLESANQQLEIANERMRLDLRAAAEIQKSLLPSAMPNVDGINIAWRYRPCDELAGDILNVFNLSEDHIGLYVLDVSGHGVPAALLAVTLSRMLSPVLDSASLLKQRTGQAPGYLITPPSEVANQLNSRFQIDVNNGQFFTLLYGVLDRRTNTLTYVSCGHPSIIHMSAATGPKLLESPSLPIGFMEHTQYKQAAVQLDSGDRIYLYSDGIPEAEGADSELFSIDRMLETLLNSQNGSVDDSVDNLISTVESWSKSRRFKDDVTLLSIEVAK